MLFLTEIGKSDLEEKCLVADPWRQRAEDDSLPEKWP
jgi:hypothetical protein